MSVLVLGPALADRARTALGGSDIRACAPAELTGRWSQGVELVLVDADAWAAPELAFALQALVRTTPPPPLLVVGQALPAGLVRNVVRLARADILEAPFSDTDLAAAVEGLGRPVPALAGPSASHCWAVTGAVGGAGATMLAIEIAHALAARADRPRAVCLIDLNLADGAVASYLGAQAAMRLADFADAAERLDGAMLQAFVTPVGKSLDLLAGPRDPRAFDTVSREAVLRLLEIACESYGHVVVDMPRHRRAWTLEALGGCDQVLVVSELTVPALLSARALSDELEAEAGEARRPKIVLNRVASRMFGPAPSLAEAERALQRKAWAGVSSDWEAAAASVNLGGPIAQHRPKSKIVRDVAALVDRLCAGAEDTVASQAA